MDLFQIQQAKFHFQPMIRCITIQDWRYVFLENECFFPIGELLPLQTGEQILAEVNGEDDETRLPISALDGT